MYFSKNINRGSGLAIRNARKLLANWSTSTGVLLPMQLSKVYRYMRLLTAQTTCWYSMLNGKTGLIETTGGCSAISGCPLVGRSALQSPGAVAISEPTRPIGKSIAKPDARTKTVGACPGRRVPASCGGARVCSNLVENTHTDKPLLFNAILGSKRCARTL